ncbi:MAG: LamG-like jellyroll fold domain-containing protein [Verrucomicrobiota bacterium]
MRPAPGLRVVLALWLALICGSSACIAGAPLLTLHYTVTGTELQVSPATLDVPTGIPGSVLVSVLSGGSTNNAASAQLSAGAYVQAVLRGPAFPQPRTIVGAPNAPLLLPAINLVGHYELDDIQLVDAVTGQTRLQGTPSTVPVQVFSQLLVSSVTSTPMTLDQIQAAGIDIDEQNFSAVQFQVTFALSSQTVTVNFPVVSPKFTQSTELIPADQLAASLQAAAVLNQKISSTMVQLPPSFQTANLNIQVQGINFQFTDPNNVQSLRLAIPPIPAIMVIPGNIGFLNQFFSVQIFTQNGAPIDSGLSISNIQAQMILPPGPDGILSTNYGQPGDDPLRFARVGPNDIIQSVQPILVPGPPPGVNVLQPGQSGQAQFLVEGLQQGLAVMNINLTGDLYGLAAGMVQVQGKAAGSVLVRNPNFSIVFSHPSVVRAQEPYVASVTLLNTGHSPANLLSVTLNQNSISGALLAPGQTETVQLGTLQPGQSATATYNMIAEVTGQITFSDLTTSSDSSVGRFNLTMGIDAEGVALSPDTLALPDYVNSLPLDVLNAANRVLGQALSVATAGQLPPGVLSLSTSTVTERAVELAEAGQRLGYGDALDRVLPDLLRDWQGGRLADDGFDQLLRVTDAGAQWQGAIFAAMEAADGLTGTGRLLDRAPDLAGLGQSFVVAAAGPGQLRADFAGGTNSATLHTSTQPYAKVYAGTNGVWAVTLDLTNAVFSWTFTNAPPAADMSVVIFGTNGQGQSLRWTVSQPPPGTVYSYALSGPSGLLQVLGGNGSANSTLNAVTNPVSELPPTLIAVQQDLSVVAGRPANPCVGPPNYYNYGTVVAVVYSKPVTQTSAGTNSSYTLGGDNYAYAVQIQPSGRVALLDLRKGISALLPRNLTVTNVTDARGNALVGGVSPVLCVYPGTTEPFNGGVSINGRALRADGTPAAGIPITLTMYDGMRTEDSCKTIVQRVSQVLTDTGGNFSFDYVMYGIPYSLSATDTGALTGAGLAAIEQSIIGGSVDTMNLQLLASDPDTEAGLLSAMSAGTIGQAVVAVQGLDRTVFNDSIPIGSGRVGQNVTIVLRFRGRGTVTGQVVASDGVTPVPQAAVNLFPDPASLDLGTGVFSDGNGQFTFAGVPLGVYTIQAQTSDGRQATVAGLLDVPNASSNIVIALPDTQVAIGTLQGQVFEPDNVTPNGNGRIFVGRYTGNTVADVVRIVNADPNGFWVATNIPVKAFDIVAVTFDGTRKGERLNITPSPDAVTTANVTLDAATTVFGQVQFADGSPVANALVAGGIALVTTDTNGNFQLQGVPVGSQTISAGLQANPAAGIPFTRLGSGSVNVIAGQNNYVVVQLNAAGAIYGKVFDAKGNPVPNVRVAIPQQGGFMWTDADGNGNYSFEDLGLGGYTLSAPANATAPVLDLSQLQAELSSGNQAQIMAAFQEAVTVFTGSEDPLITGADNNFSPTDWGYTTASLLFDGETANADIHYLPLGTVWGKVLNAQGVPIGATVELTGLGPDPTGAPATTMRGAMNSDPATGIFGFTNVLFPGGWQLQAASPFYPEVIMTNGFTTVVSLEATNIVLQFPPKAIVDGVIAGRVFYPNGTLVGQGVEVKINVAANYQILTDTNGTFNTLTAFPAGGYTVVALDPVTGLTGEANVGVTPGITNYVDVHLLTRNSTVVVTVLQANGQPAVGALVTLDQGSFPGGPELSGTTGTNGTTTFPSLWEGSYAAGAQFTEGETLIYARSGGIVAANATLTLTLTLGATGTIRGTFVALDGVTPVEGANVSIGGLGFAGTDTNGFFSFVGVPLGTYSITSFDPVTGAAARTTASVTYNGQVRTVQLVEATRGTVSGLVLDPYSLGYAPGASVTISFSDGVTPPLTVTTGPGGAFSLPGSPMGVFNLNVFYTLPDGATDTGSGSGLLTLAAPNANVQIPLHPLAYLPVRVVRNDGVTPAQNTTVTVNGIEQQDTGTNGEVMFYDLLVGAGYSLEAVSRIVEEQHNAVQVSGTVATRGTNALVTMVLPGVGSVQGVLLDSDGLTPAAGAQVVIHYQGGLFAGDTETALTDAQGRFSFIDVPVAGYLLTATSLSLAASLNGTIAAANQTNSVTMHLGASGTLRGTIVRADGATPVAGVDVLIQYASQSANPGLAIFYSGANGGFEFDNVPLGTIEVSSADPSFDGIIDFFTSLTNNGQILNLGAVPFDETQLQIVQVTPPDTTIGVPITNTVQLVFNKPLATNSVTPAGIFIQGTNGVVDSALTVQADTNGVRRVLTIAPRAPLASLSTYSVVVLSSEVQSSLVGSGPHDLVGRYLPAPFFSDFTTADNIPPVLLSLFPSNNAVQIDPSAVPRLSFNKSLNPAGFVFVLSRGGVLVPGSAAAGVDGQVLAFVPTAPLLPNATYTLTVSNVFDLAGNPAVGQPYIATFATLDTIGPTITNLFLVSGHPPYAGATVPVEADLAGSQPGAIVSFTQDFNPIGTATNPPFQINVKLPLAGSTTIRAIPTDQYGNSGQFVPLVLTVQSNQPPTVQISRVSPTNGPAPSGSAVIADVTAIPESGIAIARLSAYVGGAAAGTLATTNGTQLRVQGLVSATAVAGQLVEIYASATDILGDSSGQQSLAIPVSDGTPPTLAILAPASNTVLSVDQPLDLQMQVSDNSSNVTISLTLSGGIIATQSVALVLTPNTPITNVFTVSLAGAPTAGQTITALVVATDAATNQTAVTRTFRLPDLALPLVQSITPTNGAVQVDILPTIAVAFNEPMNPSTINAATFEITHGGVAVPGTYGLGQSNLVAFWRPAGPLSLGGTYNLTLTAGITEAGGNPIAAQSAAFVVTDFGILEPTNGATIAEGQSVPVVAGGPNPAGISAVQFSGGGTNAVGPFPAFTGSLAAPTLAQLGTNQFTISAVALGGGANVARGKVTSASSSYTAQSGPSRAVDGDTNQNYYAGSMFHSQADLHAFWEVDLGYVTPIREIDLYLRTDCCPERNRFAVLVASQPFVASDFLGTNLPASYSNGAVEVYQTTNAFDSGVVSIPTFAEGRFVRVAILGQDYLALGEVEVFAPLQDTSLAPVAVNVLSSAQAAARLPIQFPTSLNLVQGSQSNLTVSASATAGNLVSLRVDELAADGGTAIAKAEFWNLDFTPAQLSDVPFTNPPTYATTFDALSYSNSPFWPGAQAIQTAARFSGTLFVPTDGAYTFYGSSQDGSSVSIDGQLVVNDDGIHSPTETTGSVALTHGPHAFQALYFQGLDAASIQVSWSGPGLARRLVQRSDFSQFSPLQFAETGGPVVSSASGVPSLAATLQIRDSFTNDAQILLTAQDAAGLAANKLVNVVILPVAGLAPKITSPPANQTAQCGSNATFSVTATGAAPLSYQWYWFGTNQVPRGTNATLTLTDVSLAASGGYTVVVTNSDGSAISPEATLNVVDTIPPVITLLGADPMQVVQGTSFADPGATADDLCAGSVPVTASGAVNASVVGAYTVSYKATDPSGNSATNTRTVLVVAAGVACDPTPSGIAAWWKGESNTVDVVGGDSGTLAGGAGYAPGLVGTAFSFSGPGQAAAIPATPAIDLSALYSWSIEAWINPASINGGYPTIYSQGYWGASLGLNGTSGKLESWINNASQLDGTVPVPPGQWSHVALVYDGTNRTFYVNGAFAGSGVAPPVNQDSNGSAIGNVSPAVNSAFFNGGIDEVSIYSRALTSVEIAGIYAAGAAGKCPVTGTNLDVPPFVTVQPADHLALQGSNAQFTVTATGSAPLSYQWRENGTNLVDGGLVSGAATPTLSLANVSAGGIYSVAVSNLVGSRLSATAYLVVMAPPSGGGTNTFWDVQTGNNNTWSQTGAPGNWIDYDSPQGTSYYPNGTNYNVTLDIAHGAAVNLDVSVTLDTLTMINNGALNIQSGSTLTASNFYFQGDGGITVGGCCSPENMQITGGTLAKSGGTNVSTITPGLILTSRGVTLAVDSGTLALPGNNSSYSNGAFSVAANATLVLVPAGNNANFAGTFTGSGSGTVLLNAGTLTVAPGALTLDVPSPLFQWTGGTITGNPLTNAGVLTVAGTNNAILGDQLNNAGLLFHSSPANLYLAGGSGGQFENLAQATYTLASDAGISPYGCCLPTVFDNYGLFQKTGGTGNSTISAPFNDYGGTIDVQTGRLTLANSGTTVNGILAVAAGATLDVTGGSTPTWSGQMNGTGAGTVLLASGTLAASPGASLNFIDGLFQWAGGTLQGPVTNLNVVSISGTNTSYLSDQFFNLALVRHAGAGSLYFNAGPGAYFDNPAGATYLFESDAGIHGYGCCLPTVFANSGLVRKSGGTNDSSISVTFNNLGGSIQVDTGTLTLANNGSNLNGTVTVAGGAALDLTGGASPTWAGKITGAGGGSVQFNSGQINASPSLTLDFPPGMFQWSGGTFNGGVLNSNAVATSGTNDVFLSGAFSNAGLFRHTGSGRLVFYASPGALFRNLPGATYEMDTDTAFYAYGCCSPTIFENDGVLRKIGGASNTVITAAFNNLGGAVEVDSGLLTLANNGTSTGGAFTVAAGASVDLTGGAQPTWSGRLTGAGAGVIEFNNGQIFASGLILDCAPGLFQWTGGIFNGPVTNANAIDISGGTLIGNFFNAGLVRHLGSAGLALNPGTGALLRNLPGATYDFQGDGSISFAGCCSPTTFENDGLLRKSGGTNSATISVAFNNQDGSIEVDSGVLAVNHYAQGLGALTVQLAGTNSGQYGQLSAASASLSGPLNVELVKGFTPPPGSQFQILSCASLSGSFKGGGLPGGIAINYNTNGVFLVVTGAVTFSAPFIVSQPSSVQSVAGASAVFTATVGGESPLGFQWQFKGANLTDSSRITGSATPHLIVMNLGAADVGSYRLVVTNSLGSVTSTNASLSLVPCVPPPAGLAGLWTGDGSAFDWVGGHDGTLQGGAAYAPGRFGQAFALDGVSSYVDLGAWSAGSNWTWTAWVNPSSTPSGRHTIVGGVNSCLDWALTMSSGVFGVGSTPPTGCEQTIAGSSAAVPGTWYFVTASCDGSTARIYVNGQLSASGPVLTNYVGTPSGTRIGGEFCCAGDNFPGLIEEVALFNRALSDAEVLTLYTSGVTRVCLDPQILSQPASENLGVGDTASFSIVARDTGQLGYQWQFNGTNLADNTRITGSQSNILTITDAQLTDSGSYGVILSGPGGSYPSSNATLSVVNCTPAPPGLLAWWKGDGNFQDVISGFDGVPVGTVSFASAEVGQGFHLVNSAITASGNFDFSTNNAMTIELWFKLNVDTTYNGLVTSQDCCTYRFMVDGGGHLFYDPGTHTDTDLSVGPAISLGQFHHAAMVVVGGAQAVIYLDGQPISTNSAGVPSVLPFVSTFLLGAGESAGTYTMQDGILDEVTIYNRALAAQEIAAIFAAGAGGKCLPTGRGADTVTSPLRFQSITQSGASLTFVWSVVAGRSYQVQYKPTLTEATWLNLGSPVVAPGSTLSASDAIGQDSQRFYRLVQLP